MDRQLELHYRDELRAARAAVLRDAEAFSEILFAVERIGTALIGRSGTFESYRNAFIQLSQRSSLASRGSGGDRSFARLYGLVQYGRNEALHQGAFARHLADHAIELALFLEDALANGSDRISDYMVRTPVVAQLWQPIRLVRHQMLANPFSFLPVLTEDGWRLVSDLHIARMLRGVGNNDDREMRLSASVETAVETFRLELDVPQVVAPETSVRDVLMRQQGSRPVLVATETGTLIGIATPFDLL